MTTSEHITLPEPEVTDVIGASRITGLAVPTLNAMRSRSEGPPFVALGELGRPRFVYRFEDLRRWRDERLVPPGDLPKNGGEQ